jgi:hypothetical protein
LKLDICSAWPLCRPWPSSSSANAPLLPSRSALWITTSAFSATTQLLVFARRLARAWTQYETSARERAPTIPAGGADIMIGQNRKSL